MEGACACVPLMLTSGYMRSYDKAKTLLVGGGEDAEKLSVSCSLNMASCMIKQSQWGRLVNTCSEVLLRCPDNYKALYRRSIGFRALGEAEVGANGNAKLEMALKDVDRALELSKDDDAIKRSREELVWNMVRRGIKVEVRMLSNASRQW
jgi:hypothetical protein